MVLIFFFTYVEKEKESIFTALILQFYIKCDRVVDLQGF